MMQPIHVTAKMTEPVVYYGDGMHLDGVLATAAFRDLSPEERTAFPPITAPWAQDLALPLRTWSVHSTTDLHVDDRLFVNRPKQRDGHKIGSLWGWKASAVHADWLCDGRHAVRRRPEIEQMVRYTDSPSINLGAGQQKAINVLMPSKFALELHWYAAGDLDEVERLLSTHIHAVGKLTNQGPGRVEKWTVEPWRQDWSIVRDGRLQRMVPISYDGVDGYVAEASIRPPYHHASRIVMALRPAFEELTHADP